MSSDIIVLRRVDPEPEQKKGGVWKIAHADFMTALMAFFLIMWLVNATDEEIKKSIANYFNPMNLMSAPTDRRGMMDPSKETEPPASGDEEGQSTGTRPMGADVAGESGTAEGGGNVESGNDNRMASAGLLNATEGAIFHDPYAVLASSASDIDPETPVAVDVVETTLGATGETATTEETRDPFDPAYWQTRSERPARSLRPGESDRAARPAPDATIDALDRRPTESPKTAAATAGVPATASGPIDSATVDGPSVEAAPESPDPAPTTPDRPAITAAVGPRSATAEAILAAHAAQQAAAAAAAGSTEPAASATGAAGDAAAAATALREALAGASAAVDVAGGENAVLVSLTDDGAVSMFPIGSAEPTDAATVLFARVAGVLAERDGRIVIRGHTDARPFRSGESDNWTLSFARAHATKRTLQDNGVAEERFVRVEGLADREPSIADDPLAAENRRIEILYEPAGADQ